MTKIVLIGGLEPQQKSKNKFVNPLTLYYLCIMINEQNNTTDFYAQYDFPCDNCKVDFEYGRDNCRSCGHDLNSYNEQTRIELDEIDSMTILTFDVDYDFDNDDDTCDDKLALVILPDTLQEGEERLRFCNEILKKLPEGTILDYIWHESWMDYVNEGTVDGLVSDWISDTTGWCINGFTFTEHLPIILDVYANHFFGVGKNLERGV